MAKRQGGRRGSKRSAKHHKAVHWIAKAHLHKGTYGHVTPAKLERDEHSSNVTTRRRAFLADTLTHMHHHHG